MNVQNDTNNGDSKKTHNTTNSSNVGVVLIKRVRIKIFRGAQLTGARRA